MKKTGNILFLLAIALLLGGCVSVPVELKVSPTLAANSTRLSTVQFSNPDQGKVFRVVHDFAFARGMEPVPHDALVGEGWNQAKYQLRVAEKGMVYDSEYFIHLTLLFRKGKATVHLLHSREIQQVAAELELALLDTLRDHFGSSVVKIGG